MELRLYSVFTISVVFLVLECGEANRFRHLQRVEEPISHFSSDLVVNETNWQRVVSTIADKHGRIIFTTFQGVNPAMKSINANFFFWLHQSNLSSNLLLMSESKESCEMLWQEGVPCWVDNYCPRGDALPAGQYAVDRNHWYCKYWWAKQLLKNGNTALFMDNDNIVLGNPFDAMDPYLYDFEVLSDWVRRMERPHPQELLEEFCGYKATPFEGTGQRFMWDFDPENKLALSHNPCASAGLWVAYPRQATIQFFTDLLVLLVKHTEPEQWDQAAFNEMLTVHLLNVRDSSESLRFRLLPHMSFMNLPVYEQLVSDKKEFKEVVMHPCCVGSAKEEHLREVGFWKPEQWEPSWGTAIVQRFAACMANSTSTSCTAPFTNVVSSERHHHENRLWKEKKQG